MRDSLSNSVNRVMEVVQQKANGIIDTINHLSSQIDSVYKRLREKRRIWENKKDATVKRRDMRCLSWEKLKKIS